MDLKEQEKPHNSRNVRAWIINSETASLASELQDVSSSRSRAQKQGVDSQSLH